MLKRILFSIRLRRCKREADIIRRHRGLRCLVILFNGKLTVIAKQELKRLPRKQGVNIRTLVNNALYETP